MEPVAISITEAARALGIGRTSTYQLIHQHKLKTIRIGRRQLVTTASIHELADDVSNPKLTDQDETNGERHD